MTALLGLAFAFFLSSFSYGYLLRLDMRWPYNCLYFFLKERSLSIIIGSSSQINSNNDGHTNRYIQRTSGQSRPGGMGAMDDRSGRPRRKRLYPCSLSVGEERSRSVAEPNRDILIQVKSPRRGEFIILNHWQLYCNRDIGHCSISAYAAMAREKYRLRVYPVLVNILRLSRLTVISNSFHSDCLGLTARLDCQVINLWDVDVEMAFSQSLTPLLPFATIMRGGNNETVLKRVAIALEAESGFEDLQQVLAIFATFVLGVELVDRVMS